ncbi:MAG: S8 family serine peptidase [Candidatus Heimdallarchaeota archaeon]|nr:S8 family serine peptidase [Candidatus Heimdallarchaeota archaeon]
MKRKAIIVSTVFLFSILMLQMSSMMILTSLAQDDTGFEIEFVEQTVSQPEQPFVDSARTFVLHFETKRAFNNYVAKNDPYLVFENLKMVVEEDLLSKKNNYYKITGVDRVFDLTNSKIEFSGSMADVDDGDAVNTITSRDLINLEPLWDLGYKGGTTVVYDVDSGIRQDHVDFAGRIDLANSQSFLLEIYGYGGNDYSIEDSGGHGTHTAGIATGAGIGNADYIGMAPEAGILVARVAGAEPEIYTLGALAALDYGPTVGIDVANLSWGGGDSEGMSATEVAVEELTARGVVVACSAGNEGGDGFFTVGAPSSAPNVICVAGTSETGGIYGPSSNGPAAEGFIKPDVAAAGRDIWSCSYSGASAYVRYSGTSMAAPHIAGGVAVLIDALKDQGITYDPGLIKAAIMKSADPGFQSVLSYGAGIPDFYDAYQRILAAPTNGSGFPAIIWAIPDYPISTYKILPQGFHAELFVESVSSTPWNDLPPVITGNISSIINLNTTAWTGPWTKNYYLSIDIADDAVLGVYEGDITFETANSVSASTNIKITVVEGKGKILYAKMFTSWGIDNFLGQFRLANEDLLSKGFALNEYKWWNITGEANVITEELLSDYEAIWLADPFDRDFDINLDLVGYTEITDSEILAIQNFVAGGGGLMIEFLGLSEEDIPSLGKTIISGNNITRLNELLSPFDITADPDPFVFSSAQKARVVQAHAITDGVEYIDHYGTDLSVGANAQILVEYNNQGMTAIHENSNGGRVVIVSTNFFMDTSGYQDLYNSGTANALFTQNMFEWLTADEKLQGSFVFDATGADFTIESLNPAAVLSATMTIGTSTSSVSLVDEGGGLYSYRLDYAVEGRYTLRVTSVDDKYLGQILYDVTAPEVYSTNWVNNTVPAGARLDFVIEDEISNLVSLYAKANGETNIQMIGSGQTRTFSLFTSILNADETNTLEVYATDENGNILLTTFIIPLGGVETTTTTPTDDGSLPLIGVLIGLMSAAVAIVVNRRKQ